MANDNKLTHIGTIRPENRGRQGKASYKIRFRSNHILLENKKIPKIPPDVMDLNFHPGEQLRFQAANIILEEQYDSI